MRFVAIPLHADVFGSTAPTEEEVALFLKTVRDPSAQPVYFHCAHGKDRTGTMAAVYRMEVDGWSADEAIAEMQSFGYHDIYRDLIAYLRSYRPQPR
jgi:protein tyrosine/serine phosphatase